MADTHSFSNLLKRLNAGDKHNVAEVIVQRFASRLGALAARKMSQRLQQRLSPDDIVQSVFATFFRRVEDGQLEIRDWDSLWGLLAQITVWRICRHVEHYQAGRRNSERETPLLDDEQAFDREPRAEDLLMAAELCEQLVSEMAAKYRPIVQGILDGQTHEIIAKELNTSLSTVERVHRRAKERLTQILAEGLSDSQEPAGQ